MERVTIEFTIPRQCSVIRRGGRIEVKLLVRSVRPIRMAALDQDEAPVALALGLERPGREPGRLREFRVHDGGLFRPVLSSHGSDPMDAPRFASELQRIATAKWDYMKWSDNPFPWASSPAEEKRERTTEEGVGAVRRWIDDGAEQLLASEAVLERDHALIGGVVHKRVPCPVLLADRARNRVEITESGDHPPGPAFDLRRLRDAATFAGAPLEAAPSGAVAFRPDLMPEIDLVEDAARFCAKAVPFVLKMARGSVAGLTDEATLAWLELRAAARDFAATSDGDDALRVFEAARRVVEGMETQDLGFARARIADCVERFADYEARALGLRTDADMDALAAF